MHSAKPSMMVPSALEFEDVDDELASKLTIASCKTLCMPKNKNMANDRMIICCVGCNDSRKAEPKPASDLDDFLVSSTIISADGESSASAELPSLMSGCLMVSSSSWEDEPPSSMSRSSSIRGDIFLQMVIVVCWQIYGK